MKRSPRHGRRPCCQFSETALEIIAPMVPTGGEATQAPAHNGRVSDSPIRNQCGPDGRDDLRPHLGTTFIDSCIKVSVSKLDGQTPPKITGYSTGIASVEYPVPVVR